jgi:hypothetical protein
MSRELTKKEIYERMIELRNLRKLHLAAQNRIRTQAKTIRFLKAENKRKDEIIAQQQQDIQTLKLQVEELRTIVFGKKKKEKRERDDDDIPTQPRVRTPRTKESYQRPVPQDAEVTEEVHHTLSQCPHCTSPLTKRTIRTYYEEDILLQQKHVSQHCVEQGYCVRCKKKVIAQPLPSSKVVLGSTVKRYVTYLSVICRLSYTQIQDILKETYTLTLSEGEIAHILKQQSEALRPHYERLLETIRGEPSVHLDETGWNLFKGDGYRRYAWTMVGGSTKDAVFMLGVTRGKGNADILLGDSDAVVVSDDYGVYRTYARHQLCCAHILRKLRDLVQSRELEESFRMRCREAYHTFARIYADIETLRKTIVSPVLYQTLLARLIAFAVPHTDEPKKLIQVKKQVRERVERYLTCLLHPHVRADNNPAERALRHIVLKRKISFGSFNQETAERLSVLMSVLLSFKRRGELGVYLKGV